MAFSRPKAIGLVVDDDYRDDAQSASVVCRNQLWNPFSVVFGLRSGARWDVSVAPPVVSFVSRAVRHASLRRDVALQDRHTSLEPGPLHRAPHYASRIGLNPGSYGQYQARADTNPYVMPLERDKASGRRCRPIELECWRPDVFCRSINNPRRREKWRDYELCRSDNAVKPSLDAG